MELAETEQKLDRDFSSAKLSHESLCKALVDDSKGSAADATAALASDLETFQVELAR